MAVSIQVRAIRGCTSRARRTLARWSVMYHWAPTSLAVFFIHTWLAATFAEGGVMHRWVAVSSQGTCCCFLAFLFFFLKGSFPMQATSRQHKF